ncbi:sphingomyelin phosphodiesterase 2 [Alligator mississippiensis]|nr:sphingomyelin phosphodiesterase 2 [Alligator mississippiensis]XP_014460966.1 sphingomyelin phosphodiesterase 2 [Alligator mississippiensis]XP_019348119.1 sphingomyelin phosphodiesterase 2 [Alligator mississippiensis]XP_059573597.1 sphingomyelin phosphodiesterase 2 [Alligator mississippiensis]
MPAAMEKEPLLQLRVFDLNCWAIRYLSKLRQERVQMIADTLSQEGYDLVLLQEVWSETDYRTLKQRLSACYPSSHYFRSGVIGSGLCVFSKYPILDTFLYQYSLNGYPYMLQHGDWFCGKSVGLLVLKIQEIVFNIYVTHLHAEYCREKDAYLPHRVVQAWELGQFIQHTSKAADVVLLGGDLNMHPEDVGIRLLRGWTGLRDSFTDAERFEGCEDGCTLVPDNYFTNKKELQPFPLGIRIDYILYKGQSNFAVKCDRLVTTTGKAPGKSIPYSDHEAVIATLYVKRHGEAKAPNSNTVEPALVDIMNEARTEVRVGLHAAQRQRYSSGRMAILALLLLLLQAVMGLSSLVGWASPQPFPKFSFSVLGSLAVLVLLVSGVLHIFHAIEVKVLQGTEDQMRLALQSLQDRLSTK